MNATELLARFRYEVSDQELPYLWSDATVLSYIDEAQKQFCRDSYGIEDARQFKLSVTGDNPWYSVDPVILKIRSAVNRATGDPVPLIPAEKMASYGMRFDGAVGPTRALITGLEKGALRVYPTPEVSPTRGARANAVGYLVGDTISVTVSGAVYIYRCTVAGTSAAAQGALYASAPVSPVADGTAQFVYQATWGVTTVELWVFRLSEDIAAGADFEIDAQHVPNLLDWVKYRAYSIHDSEVYDPARAEKYQAMFGAYCARALNEQSRLNHTAGNVVYGGI